MSDSLEVLLAYVLFHRALDERTLSEIPSPRSAGAVIGRSLGVLNQPHVPKWEDLLPRARDLLAAQPSAAAGLRSQLDQFATQMLDQLGRRTRRRRSC